MRTSLTTWLIAAGVLWICAASAWAQTETPYERSMKQQQLYDLQQQNARQQQQQQQQQQDQLYQQQFDRSQAQQNANAAQGRQVLQTWQARPPLGAERNPLLGRWNSQGSGGPGKAPANGDIAALAAALVGGMTAGVCDSMLGRGLIEFRPNALVAIDAGGREQIRYHVEYRGGGSRVVVLPRDAASFTHMIIDFDGPDRGKVAGVGCGLVRVGAARAGSFGGGSDASPPVPAKWELLTSSPSYGGVDAYIDRSTIRKSGHVARMADLWDFKSGYVFEGKSVLSVRNEYEYDCSTPRRRMLSTRGFSQHMGRGSTVGAGDDITPWGPIPESSLFIDHWKTVCAKS